MYKFPAVRAETLCLQSQTKMKLHGFIIAIQYLGANVYVSMFRSSYPDFSVRVLGSSDR